MSSKEIVLAKWRLEDGHYVCDRLLSERKKQEHNRNARSKAGMASAEARGKRNAKRGRAKRQPEDKSWEENFNSFMAIFPKKTHLTKAKALWKRKKPDFETVKTALEWQIKLPDWTKEGGKYSPNPESYLENEQWKYENPYKKQSVPTQYGYDVAAALQRQKERSCQVTP